MAFRTPRVNVLVVTLYSMTMAGGGLVACGQGTESPGVGSRTSPSGEIARLLLFDDFEYDVARSITDAEQQFRAHGWTDAKAINSHFGRGSGYLYTRFDPIRNSRVLVMESYPSTAYNPPNFPYRQTGYWIKYGEEDAPLTTVPANVWFQFWIYATPESRFHRSKFIYPCRGPYPCTMERFAWLLGWHVVTGPESNPTTAPEGGWFWSCTAPLANNRAVPDYNRDKLYQNLDTAPLIAGRWYQVRIHVDTSGAQGVYEAWVCESGQT